MRKRFLFLILFLLTTQGNASETPNVIVSIKPVHSLVTHLLADISTPELLLDGKQSPHDYALKPSDVSKLNNHNTLIWVGPSMETPLSRHIRNMKHTTVITLVRNDVQTLEDHDLNKDPHRWLDPRQAISDMQYVTVKLSEAFPHLRTKLYINAKRLINKLRTLENQVNKIMNQKRVLPVLLTHDAWRYFTGRFRLSVQGIINPVAHHKPGTAHMHEIIKTIEENGTKCIMNEPQLSSMSNRKLAEQYNLRLLTIDPLASTEAAGADAYFNMMRSNAETLALCH